MIRIGPFLVKRSSQISCAEDLPGHYDTLKETRRLTLELQAAVAAKEDAEARIARLNNGLFMNYHNS